MDFGFGHSTWKWARVLKFAALAKADPATNTLNGLAFEKTFADDSG